MELRGMLSPGLALVLVVLAASCRAYPSYQTLIPNAGSRSAGVASKIPAPFGTANVFCESVGHKAKCDGPPADDGNPFGKAFIASGGSWTMSLCLADSDGDGVSNGVEMGDPNCAWTPGATPEKTTGLSHPGYKCSTSANPFCVGEAVKPNNDDDDNESETVPRWEAAVGCAVAIFTIKYILTVVAAMKEESAPPAMSEQRSTKRLAEPEQDAEEMDDKAAEAAGEDGSM
eukprot:scpid94866/ scgid21441/ Temptin